MIIRLFIFHIVFFTALNTVYAESNSPLAVKGVIDLRDIKDPDHFLVKLNGEWEFYWQKMLHPYNFHNKTNTPDYYGKVPSYWTDYKNNFHTSKFGYATYKLTILLPDGLIKSFGIDLPVFDSSYDLYVNDKYLGGNGIPGRTAGETKPGYRRNIYRLNTITDTLTILINVANFDHRRGGFWLPIKFGTYNEVQKRHTNSLAIEWSVVSLLIGFSLFFLFFFILDTKDKRMGYFSLATTGMALRPLFTSHYLIYNLLDISWEWVVRFEYISLFMVIIGWAWFITHLYPSGVIRKISWFITFIFTLAFFATVILPVKIFSYSALLYYPLMVILMIYLLYKSFLGALKKDVVDIVYFFSFILLLSAGIHDIRVSVGKVNNSLGYLLTYAILIFVFVQAALLLYRWVKAFHENEKLKNELKFMNANLEQIVGNRTEELQTRNIEIKNQNTKIELQNKRLSDTIQLKNRIFSVIAHDLRNPVVNILYMLNLLKDKQYKKRYDTYANSCIEYAQSVISLLENMLVWGREQEDRIKYSPGNHDLADIILTNLSMFKETADKKEITVNFTQVGNTDAFFDKDLLDIIIRNLLSNAVKYSHRGGRISILLKSKPIKDKQIIIKICDNGVGIPEDKQKNLFSFSEIESTPGTEDEQGTGLGLKLCYDLVKINNGDIVVESKEREGTCFSITLPVQ